MDTDRQTRTDTQMLTIKNLQKQKDTQKHVQ